MLTHLLDNSRNMKKNSSYKNCSDKDNSNNNKNVVSFILDVNSVLSLYFCFYKTRSTILQILYEVGFPVEEILVFHREKIIKYNIYFVNFDIVAFVILQFDV